MGLDASVGQGEEVGLEEVPLAEGINVHLVGLGLVSQDWASN